MDEPHAGEPARVALTGGGNPIGILRFMELREIHH